MPRHAFWVHGNVGRAESVGPHTVGPGGVETGIGAEEHFGYGSVFWQSTGTNWFHFPLTVPVLLDGNRLVLDRIFVLYRATDCRIIKVHAHDGSQLIEEWSFPPPPSLTGDHSQDLDPANSFTPRSQHVLLFGLGVSVQVEFLDEPGHDGPTNIWFAAVGADLNPLS